jgi:hypothetical protein
VVPEPGQSLAGVREPRFESLQRVDGPGQRPSQSDRELLRGARLPGIREQRLNGAVVRGPLPVELVDRAASGIAGPVGVLLAQHAVTEVVDRSATRTTGRKFGSTAQRVISAAAAS